MDPFRAVRTIAAALVLAVGAPAPPAVAQDDAPVDLGAWSYDVLARGWRGTGLLGGAVQDPDGARIGTVDDFAVAATGTLELVLVEDPGGVIHAVPWGDLAYDPDAGAAALQGAGGLDRYAPPGEPPDEQGRNLGDLFMASEVLGSPLAVEGEDRYGQVSDLIFGDDGRIEGLVIARGAADGPRIALPWRALRLDPEGGLLSAPYGTADLDSLAPFEDDIAE